MKDDAPPFDAYGPNGFVATVVVFYAVLYPRLRQVAREHGYALTLHGSMTNDMDVVAIPWTPQADDEITLVKAIVEAAHGFVLHGSPWDKPHGRRVWTIMLGSNGGYIDLSIMPRM